MTDSETTLRMHSPSAQKASMKIPWASSCSRNWHQSAALVLRSRPGKLNTKTYSVPCGRSCNKARPRTSYTGDHARTLGSLRVAAFSRSASCRHKGKSFLNRRMSSVLVPTMSRVTSDVAPKNNRLLGWRFIRIHVLCRSQAERPDANTSTMERCQKSGGTALHPIKMPEDALAGGTAKSTDLASDLNLVRRTRFRLRRRTSKEPIRRPATTLETYTDRRPNSRT